MSGRASSQFETQVGRESVRVREEQARGDNPRIRGYATEPPNAAVQKQKDVWIGQIGWLIPQPEVNYGLTYRNVETRSKSDGVMVIHVGPEQFVKSWKNSNEIPDRAEAEGAVKVIEELM